ncbi:MAG: hypothetical protein AAFR61_05315 [Bacteroidota bacterium]
MSAVISPKVSSLLLNTPYCHLLKTTEDQVEVFKLYYIVPVAENHHITSPNLVISGGTAFLELNVVYLTEPGAGQMSGEMTLPTLNQIGENISKIVVSVLIYPEAEEEGGLTQPQRAGTTILNYIDADED